MKLATIFPTIILSAIGRCSAFAPTPTISKINLHAIKRNGLFGSNFDVEEPKLSSYEFPTEPSNGDFTMVSVTITASLAFMPLSADAATGTNQIVSAFIAYGHYLSLLVMVGALMFERLTIAPNMSKEKEQTLVFADAAYGISAVLLLVTGYYRAVEYGKGWNFYSHEPIFWLKMIFFSVLGAASLFPTITSIKRAVLAAKADDSWQPMTEKLAGRMKTVVNAELLIMGSIPLSATLMSRGVGYTESIPYDIIGPLLTAVTAAGLGFKYAKEALTWNEDA